MVKPLEGYFYTMKDGNVYDFLDHAGYEEVAVEYNGNKYFFYGLRGGVQDFL